MSTPLAFLSGALLALLPWTSSLQDTGLSPSPPPRDPLQLAELMNERIVGCWQLTKVAYKDIPMMASDFAGYMIVMPDYLSIEMHMLMGDPVTRRQPIPYFQTGMHRWRFAGESQLQTSSLIGTTNLAGVRELTFEPPGTKRTFTLRLDANTLILDRAGESRMEFRKLLRMPFPGQQLEFKLAETKAAEAAAAEKLEKQDDD